MGRMRTEVGVGPALEGRGYPEGHRAGAQSSIRRRPSGGRHMSVMCSRLEGGGWGGGQMAWLCPGSTYCHQTGAGPRALAAPALPSSEAPARRSPESPPRPHPRVQEVSTPPSLRSPQITAFTGGSPTGLPKPSGHPVWQIRILSLRIQVAAGR